MKKSYRCSFCYEVISDLKNFMAHLNRFHKKKIARNENLEQTTKLKRHSKEKDDCKKNNSSNSKTEKSYECSLCHEVISTFINFKAHLETFHEDKLIPIPERIKKGSQWASKYKNKEKNMKSYQCSLCNQVISTTFIEFKAHLERFHEEKLSQIPMSERINEKSRWQLRFKKQDDNICHVCAMSFNTQCRLEKHVFYEHENSPQSNHVCEICISYFFNEVDLIQHNENIHDGEKICDQCGETFENPFLLKKHFKVVHSEKTTSVGPICKICKYQAKDDLFGYKGLPAHMLKKHPDPKRLVCYICNHSTTSLNDIYDHFQNQHPDEPSPLTDQGNLLRGIVKWSSAAQSVL